MITHSRFTIADSYAFLGSLDVLGIQGKFEVHSLKDRVDRPRLIVVHEEWRKANSRIRIKPVAVVQFEADGRKKCIEQWEGTPFKKVGMADIICSAIIIFQRNKGN